MQAVVIAEGQRDWVWLLATGFEEHHIRRWPPESELKADIESTEPAVVDAGGHGPV